MSLNGNDNKSDSKNDSKNGNTEVTAEIKKPKVLVSALGLNFAYLFKTNNASSKADAILADKDVIMLEDKYKNQKSNDT